MLGCQGGIMHEMRHADDAVQRGADFVAHVGQKFTLGARGFFRGSHRKPAALFFILLDPAEQTEERFTDNQ